MLRFNLRTKKLAADPANPMPDGGVPTLPKTPDMAENFKDALIDSAVVGGIAAFSAYTADPNVTVKVFLISFGVAFLVKLKDLRKIE